MSKNDKQHLPPDTEAVLDEGSAIGVVSGSKTNTEVLTTKGKIASDFDTELICKPKVEPITSIVKSEYNKDLWNVPEVKDLVLKSEKLIEPVGSGCVENTCTDDLLNPPESSENVLLKQESMDNAITATVLDPVLVETITKTT